MYECIHKTVSKGCLSASCSLAQPVLAVQITAYPVLSAQVSLVCTTNQSEVYLRVSPSDVAWVNESSNVIYVVESNTNWGIEINE